MDEIAFPIVFAEMLRREGQLEDLDPWPMIRGAAGFLVRNGPVTGQDRWEENGGYSPFSLSVEISALLIAAEFADRANEPEMAEVLRTTADAWNEGVERWTYVTDTPLAREVGVEGAGPAPAGLLPTRRLGCPSHLAASYSTDRQNPFCRCGAGRILGMRISCTV